MQVSRGRRHKAPPPPNANKVQSPAWVKSGWWCLFEHTGREAGSTAVWVGDQSYGVLENKALGKLHWYLQEVGEEAWVIRWWWWGRRRWRQRLLQTVSLCAQSPWHHVGIWLQTGTGAAGQLEAGRLAALGPARGTGRHLPHQRTAPGVVAQGVGSEGALRVTRLGQWQRWSK